MSSLSPTPRLQRARGDGRISTKTAQGQTRLDSLFQEGCAKIRLPHTHNQSLQAVLINTAGGLTGGDDLRWQAQAAAGGTLTITTQACERVYRSTGPTVTVRNRVTAGPGAQINWLPQETILFDHSRLDRTLEVELAADAVFCGIEAVLLGREAMGETAWNARLQDRWTVRQGGRLIHAEATRLGVDPDRERTSLSLLAGNNAFATILFVGAESAARLQAVRALLPDGSSVAASCIGERLIVRASARSGLALRAIVAPILAVLAGSVPRLWSV